MRENLVELRGDMRKVVFPHEFVANGIHSLPEKSVFSDSALRVFQSVASDTEWARERQALALKHELAVARPSLHSSVIRSMLTTR
jgi:hypothetical protein